MVQLSVQIKALIILEFAAINIMYWKGKGRNGKTKAENVYH